MVVPPPLMFSTMKFCPSFSENFGASTRASWSVGTAGRIRNDDRDGAARIVLRGGVEAKRDQKSGERKTQRRLHGVLPSSFMSALPAYACGMIGSSRYGILLGGEVQHVGAAEDVRRPVARIGVRERPDAFHRIQRVGDAGVAAVDFVVLAAHGEAEPIARRHHDAGRPDLDVELDRLARRRAATPRRGCARAGTAASRSDRACGARRAASRARPACADRSSR